MLRRPNNKKSAPKVSAAKLQQMLQSAPPGAGAGASPLDDVAPQDQMAAPTPPPPPGPTTASIGADGHPDSHFNKLFNQ